MNRFGIAIFAGIAFAFWWPAGVSAQITVTYNGPPPEPLSGEAFILGIGWLSTLGAALAVAADMVETWEKTRSVNLVRKRQAQALGIWALVLGVATLITWSASFHPSDNIVVASANGTTTAQPIVSDSTTVSGAMAGGSASLEGPTIVMGFLMLIAIFFIVLVLSLKVLEHLFGSKGEVILTTFAWIVSLCIAAVFTTFLSMSGGLLLTYVVQVTQGFTWIIAVVFVIFFISIGVYFFWKQISLLFPHR